MPEQTTPEDPRERQNRLLERLGTALLGLKSAIELLRSDTATAHAQQLAQGNAHLTQMALVRQALESLDKLDQIPMLIGAINEARRDIERVDRSVDEVRRDFTPVHGTPLPTREEIERDNIELGPAKLPVRVLARIGRNLPWIILGAIVMGLLLVAAMWASGSRLVVVERAPPAPPPAKVQPALPVPQLEKPHVP